MKSSKDNNRYISSARCDRELNYLNFARKASCSSVFFKEQQPDIDQQNKCIEVTQKLAEYAEMCAKKFA